MTSFERASFALSVSDAMDEDSVAERVARIATIASVTPSLGLICVRDDAMDAGMLTAAALAASGTGLGIVLESDDVGNLAAAASAIPCSEPVLCSQNGDQMALAVMASTLGAPVILSCESLNGLMELSSAAEAGGCRDIMLNPMVRNMKQCLESTVAMRRLAARIPSADRPLVVRAWSGEYALAMASVSVMRGGRLAVLDDLDPQGCEVLDSLISNFSA